MTDEAADDNKKVIETITKQRDRPGEEIVDEPDNEAADDEANIKQSVENEAADDETNVEQCDKSRDDIVDEPENEAADN